MDKDLQERIDRLVKSVKNIKENAIKDVLDGDRVAEVDPDDVGANTGPVMNKEECECEGNSKEECECEEELTEEEKKSIKKTEEVAKTIMEGLKAVKEAYFKKKNKK